MFRKTMAICLLIATVLAGGGMLALADDHVPTVGVLRFGPIFSLRSTQTMFLNALEALGLLTEAEALAQRDSSQDLRGEKINLVFGDANFDFANLGFIVDGALDEEPDALITLSTPVTLAALNATVDMDNPPAILFASVYNPFAAGIAEASCLKPAHVTGIRSANNYQDIVPLLLLQDPDMQIIGTVYSAQETSGRVGAEEIAAVGAEMGLEVLQAAATGIADLAPAAEGLVEKGAEAFLIPADMLTVAGMSALTQVGAENAIPVFHAAAFAEREGATVSAGTSNVQLQGLLLARLLSGYLAGNVDIGATGIVSDSDLTVRVNLDAAEAQDITISDALLSAADGVLKDGAMRVGISRADILAEIEDLGLAADEELLEEVLTAMVSGKISEASPEVVQILQKLRVRNTMQDKLAEVMSASRCTADMIAEQQSKLEG